MAVIKEEKTTEQNITSAGEDLEKLGPLSTVGVSVENSMALLQKIKCYHVIQ